MPSEPAPSMQCGQSTGCSEGRLGDCLARAGRREILSAMSQKNYLLANQPSELERLQLQSRVWEPSGRQLLTERGGGLEEPIRVVGACIAEGAAPFIDRLRVRFEGGVNGRLHPFQVGAGGLLDHLTSSLRNARGNRRSVPPSLPTSNRMTLPSALAGFI